jgi:hypothetical protein
MEESVIAKSTGEQEEEDAEPQDAALFRFLRTRKKISKEEASYREQRQQQQQQDNTKSANDSGQACLKCKFNLPDENMCHIVEGNVDNEYGISKYFSPKGEGMLPGDIVWEFVKRTGKKLTYEEGHVIDKGAENFQCRDCKYYMYYGNCLLIRGYTMDNKRSESRFTPEMSCGFIVKIGQGTEI